MSFNGSNFNDRLSAQKEAKLEMLKRAKAKQLDPEAKAKLTAERIERAERRVIREAEAEKKRKFKALQDAALKAEKQMKQKRNADMTVAEAKAKRDAKYAARKARR